MARHIVARNLLAGHLDDPPRPGRHRRPPQQHGLAQHKMTPLISYYIWLRSATTVLTVLSAWKLRRTHPEMPRAFVIPGGRLGLFYVVAAPVVMAMVALLGSDRVGMIGGAVAIVLGPAVYGIIALRRA